MFFRPNNAILLAGTKLKSNYKSLELTTATRLPTVIQHTHTVRSVTSYKIWGLRSNVQPCSESVKFDIKWVGKRVENRVAASCKNGYWYNTPDTQL